MGAITELVGSLLLAWAAAAAGVQRAGTVEPAAAELTKAAAARVAAAAVGQEALVEATEEEVIREVAAAAVAELLLRLSGNKTNRTYRTNKKIPLFEIKGGIF